MLARSFGGDPNAGEEVVLPFPAPLTDATAFRTTWLASSLSALKELGLFERYLRELPESYHDPVLYSVAGVWAPIDVAIAHYSACERMGISNREIGLIGRSVTKRVHGTSLSTVVRLVKESGATPWHAMMQLNRFWERVWRGGGVRVTKLGPKDALIEFGGWPIADQEYTHIAMPPITESVLELFSRRVFARDARDRRRRNVVGVYASWV